MSRHAHGPGPVHLKAVQITLVHAHKAWFELEGACKLVLVVDLDKGAKAEINSDAVQLDELGLVQEGDDQQNGIGPHYPGVVKIGRGDAEVLAQHGAGSTAGRDEVAVYCRRNTRRR